MKRGELWGQAGLCANWLCHLALTLLTIGFPVCEMGVLVHPSYICVSSL